MLLRIGINRSTRKPHQRRKIEHGPSITIFCPYPDRIWYEDSSTILHYVLDFMREHCAEWHITGFIKLNEEEIDAVRNRHLQHAEKDPRSD